MTVGSPFDARAQQLNVKRQWREWAGRFASSAYAAHHDIEVNAIRNAAALIDVSPLYKYRVVGRRTRSGWSTGSSPATRPGSARGQVVLHALVRRARQGHRRRHGGAPRRRRLPLDRRRPAAPLVAPQRRGLEVEVEEVTDDARGARAPGAAVACRAGGRNGRVLRRPALLPPPRAPRIGDLDVDVSRTGYTGDLGYELWVGADRAADLWDALHGGGRRLSRSVRPACSRSTWCGIEAGLILLEVDYTSSRARARSPSRATRPTRSAWAGSSTLDKATPFVGQAALRRETERGGPPRRLVGLELDWSDLERLYAAPGPQPQPLGRGLADAGPGLRFGAPGGTSDQRHLESGASRRTSRSPSSRRATRPWARAGRSSGPWRVVGAA